MQHWGTFTQPRWASSSSSSRRAAPSLCCRRRSTLPGRWSLQQLVTAAVGRPDNASPTDAPAAPAAPRPRGSQRQSSSSSSSSSSTRLSTPRHIKPPTNDSSGNSGRGSSRSSRGHTAPAAGGRGKARDRDRVSGGLRQVSPAQLTGLIREQTTLAGLQDLLQQNSSIVNGIHVNAALQWLVVHPREQPRSPEQLAALVQQLVAGVAMDQVTARLSANLAYHCSKLGYVEDLGLYRALLQRFMVVREEATPQATSNLLYALGSQERLQCVLEQPVVLQLLQQLQRMGDGVNAQDVSNALWAAAKVEPRDSPQLGRVVAQLLDRLLQGDLKSQDVSNTLYALALLPEAWPMDSALQLVEQMVALLPQARPQEMSNVLWALGRCVERGWLASLSEQPRPRLQVAVDSLMSALANGRKAVKPQEVSNSLWGVAVLQGQVDWRVVGQLLGRVTQQQPDPQALANACWAVTKLQQLRGAPPSQQQPWQPPFSKAVQAFVPLLPNAESQHVTNMLWACGELRHYPLQLLQAVTTASAPLPQLQQATPQAVSNLCWALAVLAPQPPPAALMASLLQRMQDLLAQQPSSVNSQALANTAWAVAVLDQQQLARQLEPLAAAAFSQQQCAGSQAEDLRQWHQVHLWLTDTQALGPAGLGAFPCVSQQQLGQCQQAWEGDLASGCEASRVQREVAKVLSSMPVVEVLGSEQRDQHDGSRSIDIVARYQGQLLAVEVDGPHHFTWPGQRPTGDTLARNRALQRRGYRVVAVPVDPGWAQKRGQQQQQQQYLRGLLDAAVGQPLTNTSSSITTTTSNNNSSSSSSSSDSNGSRSAGSGTAPSTVGRSTASLVKTGPVLLSRPQRPPR